MQGFVELLFDLVRVGSEVELTPEQRLGTIHHNFDSAGDRSTRVEREIGGMGRDGVLDQIRRRINGTPGILLKPAGERVIPGKLPERTELLAGIEIDVLPVDMKNDEEIVELMESEIAWIEDLPAAISDLQTIRLQARGPGKRQIERCNVVA